MIGSLIVLVSLLTFAAGSIFHVLFYVLFDTPGTEPNKGISSVEPTEVTPAGNNKSATLPEPTPTVSYSLSQASVVQIRGLSPFLTKLSHTLPAWKMLYIDYLQESGVFELPINGASGYASIPINLREGPSTDTNTITTLNAGQGFTILKESDDWWQIEFDGKTGWVMHQYCLINLPDIIPSIIYDNSNAYSSKMKSSRREIPNITGQALYQTYLYNERFDEDMYVMPVLYAMASKISAAQQAALAEGNTLIIYEAFRPYDVQRKIVENLSALVYADPVVQAGLTKPPWSMGWFIATGISNHQRGYAIDVSLGKIIKQEIKTTGFYAYKAISEYTEYSMPTEIHELSTASVTFESPVSSKSATAWLDAKPSATMNSEALLLQRYTTDAGLTPLASEWWHFEDSACLEFAGCSGSTGEYFIQENYSVAPSFQQSTN